MSGLDAISEAPQTTNPRGEPPAGLVTELIESIRLGHDSAKAELLSVVYYRIREIARFVARQYGTPETLCFTGICHDACANLLESQALEHIESRRHLYALFAKAVRNTIVDYARRKRARKRGGNLNRVDMDLVILSFKDQEIDLLALHEALDRLASIAPRAAEVVELRFFGGLTIAETASALGSGRSTVESDWRFARAFLSRELQA